MADNPYRLGIREFSADFAQDLEPNVSLTRRPGALTLDYLTCFTIGPRALADTTGGAVDRAWKIRYDTPTKSFYAAAANDTNTDWQPETFLFTHVGDPFDEIDAAFDQQAHIVVAGQRAGHVWIYYFNGLIGDFAFEDFGAGRTPKILLDNPFDVSNSDVLVFYIDDAANKIRFRQQRDRYQVVYDTPAAGDLVNSYIEDAIRSRDFRIHVYWSTRHDLTGKYTLDHIETTMFPAPIWPEDFLKAAGAIVGDGTLAKILIIFDDDVAGTYTDEQGPTQGKDDALTAGGSFGPPGEIHDTLIQNTLFDHESMSAGGSIAGGSGTLVIVGPTILTHTLFDPETLKAGASFGPGGTLFVALIQHTLFDHQDLKAAASFGTGGTLV
jgi:hypothetical protein